MSLRKPNLHHAPREISQSERRLHCRNLFLVANEKCKWPKMQKCKWPNASGQWKMQVRGSYLHLKNGVLSNFTRSHISSDRVRSGYEINFALTFRYRSYFSLSPFSDVSSKFAQKIKDKKQESCFLLLLLFFYENFQLFKISGKPGSRLPLSNNTALFLQVCCSIYWLNKRSV